MKPDQQVESTTEPQESESPAPAEPSCGIEAEPELVPDGASAVAPAVPQIEAAPLAAPSLAPADYLPNDFDTADADFDIRQAHWLVFAQGIVQSPVVIARDPVRDRLRQLKRIHDKAAGREAYMHEVPDEEAERQAYELRWHAARRAGDLRINAEAAGLCSKGRPQRESQFTLDDVGMSRRENCDWKGLARLSDEEFEAQLATGKTPYGHVEEAESKDQASSPQPVEAPDADDAPAITPAVESPGVAAAVAPARRTADDDLEIPEILRRRKSAVVAAAPPPAE